MAYLKTMTQRCDVSFCPKTATTAVYSRFNTVTGEYCKRHGEARLAEMLDEERLSAERDPQPLTEKGKS